MKKKYTKKIVIKTVVIVCDGPDLWLDVNLS